MPKVGDKFIIKIGEVYSPKDDGSTSTSFNLYRIFEFNSLVFDEFGIQKLIPFDSAKKDELDEAYQRGIKDGKLAATGEFYAQGLKDGYERGQADTWAWCGDYIPAKEDGGTIPVREIQRIFAVEHFREIFKSYTPFEAKVIVEDYLESVYADLPAVGDEVRYKGDPPSKPFVVSRVTVESSDCFVDGIYDNGGILEDGKFSLMEKTGRHFPIADLLKQMEASDEGN